MDGHVDWSYTCVCMQWLIFTMIFKFTSARLVVTFSMLMAINWGLCSIPGKNPSIDCIGREKFWLRNIFEFVRSDCWIRFRLIWFTIGRERIWFIINKSWQVLEGIRHKTRYRLYTIQEAKGRAASPLCSGKDGLETENNVLWFGLPGWPMTTIADDLSHKPGCQKTQGCPPVLSAPGWKKICCCYGGNWSRIQRRKDWY